MHWCGLVDMVSVFVWYDDSLVILTGCRQLNEVHLISNDFLMALANLPIGQVREYSDNTLMCNLLGTMCGPCMRDTESCGCSGKRSWQLLVTVLLSDAFEGADGWVAYQSRADKQSETFEHACCPCAAAT
jgi:hypothetical protein